MSVERFAAEVGPQLRHALVAAYGLKVDHEAAAEAMAYAVEHGATVREMANSGGVSVPCRSDGGTPIAPGARRSYRLRR